MKFKPKTKPVWLECRDGDKYVFKNGVAKVPGMKLGGKPCTITLKEFKEITS